MFHPIDAWSHHHFFDPPRLGYWSASAGNRARAFGRARNKAIGSDDPGSDADTDYNDNSEEARPLRPHLASVILVRSAAQIQRSQTARIDSRPPGLTPASAALGGPTNGSQSARAQHGQPPDPTRFPD